MSRAIDADALIEFIENRYDITWKEDYEGGIKDACVDILEEINKMPTIEAEQIVRCKDCKWYGMPGCALEIMAEIPTDDDFCSFAERKDT